MANRYTKVSSQGGGGGSAYSTDVPKFPDMSSYLSNMDKIRAYNEHGIKKVVDAQEDSSKLHLGLLKYFDGTEAYFSKYGGDKLEFNKIVDDYHRELQEVSKNPNDPYINVKVAEIGTKMSKDLAAGKLGAIMNNAKVYNQRLKDLEDNKQFIGLDPAMSKDFDEVNQDFSSTVQYNEKGEEKLNYLKYAPMSPFLDIDKGLHNHMADTKPSTLANPEPLQVLRLQGDANGRYVVHKQDIGVDESTAYRQVKSYFDSLAANPDSEYKRRLVKEFEKESDGKGYIVAKDKEGNEIKQGLSDFINRKNAEQAYLRKDKYVYNKTDEKVDRVATGLENANIAEKQEQLQTEQWRQAYIREQIRSSQWNDEFKKTKYLAGLKDDDEGEGEGGGSGKGKGKKAKSDAPDVMPYEGGTSINNLPIDYLEKTPTGKSKMTDKGLEKLNNPKDPNYNNYVWANKRYKSSINKEAGNFTTQINEGLKDLGWKASNKFDKEFVHSYLLELANPEFRAMSNSNKSKHLLKKLNEMAPKINDSKSKASLDKGLNYFKNEDNLDELTTVIKRIEGMPGINVGDRVINPKDYYKEMMAESLNTTTKQPEIVLNLMDTNQKKANQRFLNDVFAREEGKLKGMNQDDFIKAMEGRPVRLGDKSISFTIPVKDKDNDNKITNTPITITDPDLVRGYSLNFAKEAIKSGTHDKPVPQFYQFPVNNILENQGRKQEYERFISNRGSYRSFEVKDSDRELALTFHDVDNRESLDSFKNSRDYNSIKTELEQRGIISANGGVVAPFIVVKDSSGEMMVETYHNMEEKRRILNTNIKEVK